MDYTIRPLGPWLEPVTANRRGAHLFRVGWDATLKFLAAELDQLGADRYVLQVDVIEAELRRDGMLRTHARVGFPGVRVSFESVHGPLTYATDAYERVYGHGLESWQANVRAIALALEALRAVDRYGVSGRGQQYAGWTAITSRPAVMTREQAAEFIAHWAGEGHDAARILVDGEALKSAHRAAARVTHPDRTRDDDTMARLNVARDRLTGGGRD
jgi:hypothetical protein